MTKLTLKELNEDIEQLTSIYPCGITVRALADFYSVDRRNASIFISKKLDESWESIEIGSGIPYKCIWPKAVNKTSLFGKRPTKSSLKLLMIMEHYKSMSLDKIDDKFFSDFCNLDQVKTAWNSLIDYGFIQSRRIKNNSEITKSCFKLLCKSSSINPYLLPEVDFKQ